MNGYASSRNFRLAAAFVANRCSGIWGAQSVTTIASRNCGLPGSESNPSGGLILRKFRTPDMLQDGLQNDGLGELGCEPKPVRFFRIRNWKSHDSALSESVQVFIAYIL